MAKLPSFQFYPGDWLKDPDLRVCSPFARGLLIDLLCFCFESDRRGYLIKRNGKPWTAKDVFCAAGAGMTIQEIEACWEELHENKVLKIEESTGCSYSARMVRDEEIREIRSKAGKKGGNPEFVRGKRNPYYKQEDKHKDKQKDKRVAKQKITPSSSSSSSDIHPLNTPPQNRKTKNEIESPEGLNESAWCEYIAYRTKAKLRKLKSTSVEKQMRWLVEQGDERIQGEIIQQTIRNGYQGLFELKTNGNGNGNGNGTGNYANRESAADRAAWQAAHDEEIIKRELG